MKSTIDEQHLDEGAEAWWRSLTPAQRGVYLQALWEVEDCPEPYVNGKKAEKPAD